MQNTSLNYSNSVPHEQFKKEFLKKLKEAINREEECITRNLLDRDNYTQRVGKIQGFEEAEYFFDEIFKVFY